MLPTKTIFRIEDRDTGFGCFTSRAVSKIGMSVFANSKRPAPRFIKKTNHFKNCRFAFSSKTQMLGWFTKRQINKLLQQNCRVVAITVPKKAVARLNKQVVYDHMYTLKIQEIDVI